MTEHGQQLLAFLVGAVELDRAVGKPPLEIAQPALPAQLAAQLGQHALHPFLAARRARDGGRRRIEDVGADLAAEHRGRMAVHDPLQQVGGRALARVAAEQGGMRSGENAVEQLLHLGELGQRPPPRLRRHLPAHAQAGEAVGERLPLGLADQLQPRACAAAAPRCGDLAERAELRLAAGFRREAGGGQRALETAPVGAAALIEAALTGGQPGREEGHHRGARLGGSFIDQADMERMPQVGEAAAAKRCGGHGGTSRMFRWSGGRIFGQMPPRLARRWFSPRFGGRIPRGAPTAAGVERLRWTVHDLIASPAATAGGLPTSSLDASRPPSAASSS